MFCKTCGKEMPDDALFCADCGATVEAAPAPLSTPAPGAAYDVLGGGEAVPPAKKTLQKPAIFAIAGAAVLLLLVVALAAGGGYKRTVKQYFKALENADGKALLNLYSDYYIEDATAKEKKEYAENLSESIEDILEDYGKRVKISYEILEAEEDEEFLEDYDLEDSFKAMMRVTVEVKIKGSEDRETDEMTLMLVKEKGKWCILMDSFLLDM